MIRLLYGVVRRGAGGIRAGPVCRRQIPGREVFTSPAACSSGTRVPIGTSTARSSFSLSLSLSSHSPNHSLFSLSSSYRRYHSSSSPASLLEGRETYVEASTPSCIIKEDWSVDVKHNESHKFTVPDLTHLTINQVSLVQEVKNGGKGVVGDFSVWCHLLYDEKRIELIIATLSSEHASKEIDELFLSPDMTIDLSHGSKEGTVQFRGYTEKREEPELAFSRPITEEEEEEHVDFADRIPVFGEGSWEWSVVVNPNERLEYTVEDDTFNDITRVAFVNNGGEGVVEEFNVYCTKSDYSCSEKNVLAILSSEHTEEVVTDCRLQPGQLVEFSLGRRDVGGSVHIHGVTQKHPLAARRLKGDESSEVKDHVPRLPFLPAGAAEKANIRRFHAGCHLFSSRRRQLTPLSSGATNLRKFAASKPTIDDCMAVVTCFPGFEVRSSEYTQALHLFLNESARVGFMVQETRTSKMEFLKALIAAKQKQDN